MYSSQNQEITKPQLIIGQGNMIIGELTPLSFHTFLLFKYPIRVKLTQNILREILDISLNYWWLRYKCLSDIGGFSLGWNLTRSAFGLSIEFRLPPFPTLTIPNHTKLQIINYKLPLTIATYKLPLTSCQLQMANYKLPITSYQLQIANY